MTDLFGRAILDFATYGHAEDIITETSISEADPLPVSYLFRGIDQMPEIEKRALRESRGRVLDVGCGAGSHSLYLRNQARLDVLPVDISHKSVTACRMRGLTNARCSDVMMLDEGGFDTVLALMNGTGVCGRLEKLPGFLLKLKSLMKDDGQILIDSSDLRYMYDDDDLSMIDGYYGEVIYTIGYKGIRETTEWLYVDFETLKNFAASADLEAELIERGPNFDYLARLTKKAPPDGRA